jgi:hypothetical protein
MVNKSTNINTRGERSWAGVVHLSFCFEETYYRTFHRQYFNYMVAVSFIGARRKQENTDLPQITDKLHHIMLYLEHIVWAEFKLTMLVVCNWIIKYLLLLLSNKA